MIECGVKAWLGPPAGAGHQRGGPGRGVIDGQLLRGAMIEEFGVGLHCHHDVLCEVIAGLSERVAFIDAEKSVDEVPLRKRLIQIVPDEQLPAAMRPLVRAAREAWVKFTPLDQEYQARSKALDDEYWAKRKPLDEDYRAKVKLLDEDYRAKVKLLQGTMRRHMPALVALHGEFCPGCPWDGHTIFPEKVR